MDKKSSHLADLSKEDYHLLTGFGGDWRDSWWCDDFLAMMGKKWNLDAIQSVLDVGCGVGHWGQRLMRHLNTSTHLYGVDAEETWIEGAQKRALKLKLEKQTIYLVSHAETLPFEENSMDMVTCQTLLIHVADMKKVIQEMGRVLKPGGLFLFAEPNI